MEKETESNSIPSSSSSRSSSITSDSSDEHFNIRHFPLPRPSLSASVAQKQRETHQNHFVDLPGYDLNRIPSSVFSTKPANSMEWSIASNESLFSIHDGNFSISTREDHGSAATSRLVEIPRFEEMVHVITELNPVHLPPVTKPKESEQETISEKNPYQVEISVSEINDEEEDKIKGEALVEIEIENPEVVEDVKENKPVDSNSTTSNSHSVSCRSDTSNNSIGSFAFPMLQKEDEVVVKTPSFEIKENVSLNRKPESQLSQSQMQPSQPQPLESSTLTQTQPQFESPKVSRNGWLSCFHCPLKCGLFK